ncbi:MAG: hypothetical protein LM558_02425 [Thermosphaera sp.]|nr:hypothetical protein [Thermosphaera sp.]
MRLLYVELTPGFKRRDIFERIRALYGRLSYENLEVGLLTTGGKEYILEKLGRGSSTLLFSTTLEDLLKEFFNDCRSIHVLREDGAVSKPVEDCFISGVHSDPPEELEQVLTALFYSVFKTSLGPTPYLASALIPILYRLRSLEHIFNMFTV